MMFGLHERFEYFECSECGCVQIAEIPPDMQKYYPTHYYSLQVPTRFSRVRSEFRILRTALLQRLSRGKLSRSKRPPFVPPELPRTTRVLEVGCGRGYLVEDIFRSGFPHVMGIDPFMAKESERTFPFRLERATAADLEARNERFGFIYLSHSLEHMPNQQQALESVRRLLTDDGSCCVRLPWVSSEAWENYREDWVQLDAPRHFYLHSKRSLELLVARAGFSIAKLWCDSTGFQFWGSEQYRQDIPLFSSSSWAVAPERSVFRRTDIEAFDARAKELNALQRGDQIVAWLRPAHG